MKFIFIWLTKVFNKAGEAFAFCESFYIYFLTKYSYNRFSFVTEAFGIAAIIGLVWLFSMPQVGRSRKNE